MFAPLLLVLAAAPAPHALPDADLVVHLPSVEKTDGVMSFLRRAGEDAPTLRPESWADEMHPLLQLDLNRTESFTEAGLDPKGWATVSMRRDLRLSCHPLTDAAKFQAQADARLRQLGDDWSEKVAGVTLHGAQLAHAVHAGYVVRGKVACAADGTGSDQALRDAARWLAGTWPRLKEPAGVSGEVLVATRQAVFGVTGDRDHLEANGVSTEGARALLPAIPTSLGGSPSGLLWARAHMEPSQLAASWLRTAEALCRKCNPKELEVLRAQVGAQLTGEVLVRVDRIDPKAPLSTVAGRMSAPRFANALAVKNAEAVTKALQGVRTLPGGKITQTGAALAIPGGEISLDLVGQALVVSNDDAARTALTQGLGTPAKMAHAAEVFVDPRLVARGLSRVSLLDVLASKELAGAFAAATELGRLLADSQSITAWADPSGETLRFSARWSLPAGH